MQEWFKVKGVRLGVYKFLSLKAVLFDVKSQIVSGFAKAQKLVYICCMPEKYNNNIPLSEVNEPDAVYNTANQQASGFVFESEDDRLLKDANLPPIQKLMSFTKMIRRNAMLRNMNHK